MLPSVLRLLSLLPFVALPATLFAQDSLANFKDPNRGQFGFFSIKLHTGRHLYTGQKLGDELKNGYGAIEMRIGWQAKGKNEWEQYHNYPSYGLGWYSGYVGDIDVFGNPHAFFGFITFPIKRGKRNDFQVEPALGLTYNLKPYNPNTNEINDAIGARFAVYFALHAGGKYRLTREMDLLYGIDLTHFSNGRTFNPNMGLNMAGISAGARYNFNRHQRKVDNSLHPTTVLEARPTLPPKVKPRKQPENHISLYQALGTVQNKDDAGTDQRYLTSSTVLEFSHKFNTKHGISGGFDLFVDPSARDTAEYPMNKEKLASVFPAIHAGYDFMFWRFSIRLQVGANLTKIGREIKGGWFMRPALRFDFGPRWFGQLGLKTLNGGVADWVELGAGFKLWKQAAHPEP